MAKTKMTEAVLREITESAVLNYPTHTFKNPSIVANKKNKDIIDAKADLCWDSHKLGVKWKYEKGSWRCSSVSIDQYDREAITTLEVSITNDVAKKMNEIDQTFESNKVDR